MSAEPTKEQGDTARAIYAIVDRFFRGEITFDQMREAIRQRVTD